MEISEYVWRSRYRADGEASIADTFHRVSKALARAEKDPSWEDRFFVALERFRFLPGGRILAGAGVDRHVTLFNCFVMGAIEDDLERIFDGVKEAALTMQQGGGVGYDFSTLRPRGSEARSTGRVASGVVSFMRVWDAMCATVLSIGERRGAMMATLRADHPDIEDFIEAKKTPGELLHFNLSVQVTDDLMRAIERDAEWPLVFLSSVVRRVRARDLWDRIMRATYERSEPGVVFVDRVNRLNNLWYEERISATNPCGEIPLPPYGACDLGSINLVEHVREPFTERASFDLEGIRSTARLGVRLLDDVIDISEFPLPAQAAQARRTRRVGLGITGLADALIMLRLRYDGAEARKLAEEVMREICCAAYRESIEIAREKGPFPAFDRERYLDGAFVSALPGDILNGIRRHGIRNSHLLAIAPTGTISLFAGNVSSGIEPVFAFEQERKVRRRDGELENFVLEDRAYRTWRDRTWRDRFGSAERPEFMVDAQSLDPHAHLEMQAVLQPFVDNGISKTINVPPAFPFERFQTLYRDADRLGLKGCTTFRPTPLTGEVLGVHCCSVDREGD